MEAMLETPSRVWRRIEAIEGRDMPSLPSLPPFEDSDDPDSLHEDSQSSHDVLDNPLLNMPSPIQSTPAPNIAHNTVTSTIRPPSSTSSTARFATSIASRASKSSLGLSASRALSKRGNYDSFDVSIIPSLPNFSAEAGTSPDDTEDEHIVPGIHLPETDDEDLSLTDALQPISPSASPLEPIQHDATTPKKSYDYSISLKSEPKASPFDKYRNVALRKIPAARTRTPSLSRTSSSQSSSPANSTPQSSRSFALPRSTPHSPANPNAIPLPRSTTASPIVHASRAANEYSDEDREHETSIRSMDITDIHISTPPSTGELSSHEKISIEELISEDEPDHVKSSEEEQEPTFSSDGGPTPHTQPYRNSPHTQSQSPGHLGSSFSSPSQTAAFTPTPAYPRNARFAVATSDATPDNQENEAGAQQDQDPDPDSPEDPLTPRTRRKSFFLSVINSTTRPRFNLPTPHPRSKVHLVTPGTAESTPGPRISLHTAFAGVTPRPRPGTGRHSRVRHSLAQPALPTSPVTSHSETALPGPGDVPPSSSSSSGNRPGPRRASLGRTTARVPVSSSTSPYDGAVDRASFVSTASSHDLTTHHRVNTSFDPSMGFGAGAGQGVGRFNAAKLNSYLHGLNRRLQEENEALLERLKKVEEKKSSASNDRSGRRSSAGGNRASLGGTALGDVEEDVGGEGWMEEKAELDNMIEGLREELAQYAMEKEEILKALEGEKEERAVDKEEWRERLKEVQQGVAMVVKELETRAEVSEKRLQVVEHESLQKLREQDQRLTEAQAERDVAVERAEKAEHALESGMGIGGELRDANERLGKVMGDLRNANAQIRELEAEIMRSDSRIDDLEKGLQEDRDTISGLEEELNCKAEEVDAAANRIQRMAQEAQQAEERLDTLAAYVAELEAGAVSAVERIESLEDELSSANDKLEATAATEEESREKANQLEAVAQKSQEMARQMEDALEDAEKKMQADEEEIHDLQSRVASLERERNREASILEESSRNPFTAVGPTEADLEALENELEGANKEIARLSGLLSQSPARKAIEKAREAKLEMLEREKEELLERNRALKMAMNEMNTPSRVVNASGISPIHRQVLAMSIRAPKTPGAPLRDLSWLNSVSSDPTASPLIAEIQRLQKELDYANESIDDKLDKLEDAGQGVVGLTRKLEDARSKVSELEEEVARLSRREERRQGLMQRMRCQKCHIKVTFPKLSQLDQSSLEISKDELPMEPPTPPTRTSEALRASLKSVNNNLESLKKKWEEEKQTLLGEKAVLQDATHRLNSQVQSAREEIKRAEQNEKTTSSVQAELDKAKQVIAELEANLKAERGRLRTLTSKQSSVERESDEVLRQMQRTESDMDDVKRQLQKYKKENNDLERELRENANAEQKARLLEKRVAENSATIDHLRQERSLLVNDHKELQHRFAEISEQANQLRKQHDTSSLAHENRRQQLDTHLAEINELRRALSDQTDELQRAEMEKDRIATEKSDVARMVASLEADLRRVKKDAEAFGRDLKLLRAEKEKQEAKHKEEIARLDRTKKQTHTQIRLLNDQLDNQREKADQAKQQLQSHVCAADESALAVIRLQHNKECKGLIVQIRYLKAKFTRESSWRSNLIYQKQYLMVLLSQFEKSEQTIFASIAQIGFPISLPSPVKKTRRFKSAALVVIFLSRATRGSNLWREQSSSKQAVVAALQDVRRRRAEAAS